MKILHIIDNDTHHIFRRSIKDLIYALKRNGIQQEILASEDNHFVTDLKIPGIVLNKKLFGETGSKINIKLKTGLFFTLKKFAPDIVITWGERSLEILPLGKFLHVSYAFKPDNLSSYKDCDYIFTNNQNLLTYFKRHGWSGDKSRYIPMFSRNQPIKELKKQDFYIPSRSKVIFTCANLVNPEKFENLFKAVASIPELYLFVIGEGEDEEKIKELAQTCNVKPRTRFMPFSSEIKSILSICEFSIFPFEDDELFRSILDCFDSKKLIIAEKNSMTEHFIKHNYTGYLIENLEYKSMANVIMKMLGDGEYKKTITENAFKIFENKYNEEKVLPKYVNHFTEICEKFNQRNDSLDD